MTKQKLKQYLDLIRESAKLQGDISKLYKQLEKLPDAVDRVKGSTPEHPYIETSWGVRVESPEQASVLKRIEIKKNRLELAEHHKAAIESFIADIPCSLTRQIFELVYIDGKSHEWVGDALGYTRSRISQIIRRHLED